MKCLPKGALVVKLVAILASVTLLAPLSVAAQDSAPQEREPMVKTLPPLADEAPSNTPSASPQLRPPVLQFSPSTTPVDLNEQPLLIPAPPGAKAGSSPSNPAASPNFGLDGSLPPTSSAAPAPVSQTGAPAAVSAQQPAPEQQALASDSKEPASTDNGQLDEVLTTPDTSESAKSTSNDGRELASSAPAETTAPEAVPSEAGGSDTESGSAGQIAQGVSGSRGTQLVDPSLRKLPGITGGVQIKRGFKYFPTSTIIHNLSFRDTPVKEVIAELGARGNLNLLVDKSVQGRITGNLHDVTLNEAMDSVLSASGIEARQLDNSTIIIGSPNALALLGLNRTQMRAFKLSYASPFQVANILWASVFNRGFLPDYTQALRSRTTGSSKESPSSKTTEETLREGNAPAPGGSQRSKSATVASSNQENVEENEAGEEYNQTTRPDAGRTIRGAVRQQQNEGTGFNSAAVDPGSETVRAVVSVTSDFAVEQNAGAAIVIPDTTNNQILVCGTPDDLMIAEEAIRLLDRRPRQVHIQSSLVEIQNQGIRQLGAALDIQGGGASSSILGGSGAPLIQFLPGLGSLGQQVAQTFTNGILSSSNISRISGIAPTPLQFSQTLGGTTQTINTGGAGTVATPALTTVPGPPNNGFNGFLGTALPINPPSIAGIQAVQQSQTGFNFLTLSKKAGGAANIATMPTGLNLSLNLVLQNNKAKILANPSVTVSENTEALITLADEVVHKVTTTVSLGVVSTNVELVKAGIFLNVLPRVTEDGFIMLRLRPQVSAPLGGPQTFAGGAVIVTLLNIREIITQEVRVKNGQTLVIGGMFTERETATLSKVPYLAEAPILGALFRNSIKGRNRVELMLMITPKIVEEQPQGTSLTETATPRTL